jgi:hypothetical protein
VRRHLVHGWRGPTLFLGYLAKQVAHAPKSDAIEAGHI